MKIVAKHRRIETALALALSVVLVGCGGTAVDDGNRPLEGEIKVVFARKGSGLFSFGQEYFLVSGGEVYHLTFASSCKAVGGADSPEDGQGVPLLVGGKHFLLRSGGIYRITGEPNPKGIVLTSRETKALTVTSFECVRPGEGMSFAYHGWYVDNDQARVPANLPDDGKAPENGVFVNDAKMTVNVQNGMLKIGGGPTVDINSTADWALESSVGASASDAPPE